MPPFLHDRLQLTEQLLVSVTAALRRQGDGAPTLVAAALSVLDDMEAAYSRFGCVEGQCDVAALRAQLTAVIHGLDPATSTQITTRRRERQRAAALQVLLQSGQRLRAEAIRDQDRLDTFQQQLIPVVQYGLANGILTADPDHPMSPEQLAEAWQTLLNDPQVQALARQLAMNASRPDVVILLGDDLACLTRR